MMYLPNLPYVSSPKKSFQTGFGGYNHTLGAGDGEIYDMLNLTSDHYPVLSSRDPRYKKTGVNADNGIIYADGEQYSVQKVMVSESEWYMALFHRDKELCTVADSEKKFALTPYYLVIYPDKKVVRLKVKGYYDDLDGLKSAVTSPAVSDIYGVATYDFYYWDGGEWTQMEMKGYYVDLDELQSGVTDPSVNDIYGIGSETPYDFYYWDGEEWTQMEIKGYYVDLDALQAAVTSPAVNDIYGLVTYESYYWDGEEWTKSGQVVEAIESTWTGGVTFIADGEYAGVPADNNTIYNASVDWADYFSVGDAVKLSGCTEHDENNIEAIIREIDEKYLRFYENIFTLDEAYSYKLTEPLYIGTDAIPVRFQFSIGDLFFEIDGAALKTYATMEDDEYYLPEGSNFSYGWYLGDSVYYKHEGPLGSLLVNVNASIYHYLPIKDDKTEVSTFDAKKYYCTWNGENCYFEVGAGTAPTLYEGYFEFSYVLNTTFNPLLTFHYGEEDTLVISLHDAAPDTCGTTLNISTESKSYDETSISIKRNAPDMDFLLGHHNRIWGCKGDMIYASKLGDPFNFNVFDGLSTDSFVVESGTPGDFTAAFSYLGYPLFFKENSIIKMYGDRPSDFQAYNTATNGVAASSDKSLAIAGETLYYHNKAGIMAYTGGIPSLVSPAFGNILYRNGVGGSDGMKYYVDLTDSLGSHHLFVYDPLRNLWMKEETHGINCFVNFDGELWAHDGDLITMSARSAPDGATADASLVWSMETADITGTSPNKKGISGFQIRCEVTDSMTISLKCDNGAWAVKYKCNDMQKKTLLIPIIPQRADHYRLKLEGTGDVKLFGLAIQYYDGSEI